MAVVEDLTEDEAYLWVILQDESGIDQAEFSWVDEEKDDGCFRVWPFQWSWWRNTDPLQIDQAARSVGKSLSIKARAYAFPFVHPGVGSEMVITAPEGVHLDAITDVIESAFLNNRLGMEMLKGGRQSFRHKPFHCIAEGQRVLTERGWVPIEEVMVGDSVLTHKNRWRPVTHVFDQGVQPIVRMTGRGGTLDVTSDHELFASRLERPSGGTNRRNFPGEPLWVSPSEWVTKNGNSTGPHAWASPAEVGLLDVPDGPRVKGGIVLDPTSEDFLWFLGEFLAEGCTLPEHSLVVLTVHDDEVDYVEKRLQQLGLNPYISKDSNGRCTHLRINSKTLAVWLHEQTGRYSHNKTIPAWCLGTTNRRSCFEGLIYGDGHIEENGDIRYVTASRSLALSVKLLAHSFGYGAGIYVRPSREVSIKGRQVSQRESFEVHISDPRLHRHRHTHFMDGHAWQAVTDITDVGQTRVYDLRVEEDHSFVVEGIVVSNCNFKNGARIMGRIPQRDGKGVKGTHPVWLELDEAQDYPEPGWTELNETLKRGHEGAVWRAHGVTRGVQDTFYKYTSDPNSNWTVHRITAMHRPTWTDEERKEKIEQYGGRDDPDYRRNILGLHGDSVSPIFVVHRLFVCVDDDKGSHFNDVEYCLVRINEAYLRETGYAIEDVLDFPIAHLSNYKRFWAGMDVGWTNHPSEILVFAEHVPKGPEAAERKRRGKALNPSGLYELRLITRINLTRISTPDQIRAIHKVIQTYKPVAFSLDKTGAGLPLFQVLQEENKESRTIIKGYNFSGNILVDFDQSIQVEDDLTPEELAKAAGIKRNTVEYATDVLRQMVDQQRLWLPWDEDLLGEFQGQTYKILKTVMNQYGKREYSGGKFHALDAARMAVLGYQQYGIEEFMKKAEEEIVIARFSY